MTNTDDTPRRHLTIDRAMCMGTGSCWRQAPDLVTQGDDGLAHAAQESVPDDRAAEAEDVIDGCPTGAIDWADA